MTIDWNSIEKEVTNFLQHLIRCNTTNPPGNEILCANYIAEVLKDEGIDPTITESEPGRGNVTARLKGGNAPALMLLGHTDVVAVEPDKWSRDPFGGELHNGYIWGRGALDMKNMVAAELMVFLLLKRQGVTLNRDVIYAATADEEAGRGNHGIGWLIDHHPEQVDAKYVLTEGGGGDFYVNGKHFYTCQTGQKGIFRFRLKAKGRPGHGSRPHRDNAVVKLSRAIAALGQAKLPMHPSKTLRAFLEGIAATQDDETAQQLRCVLDETDSENALQKLPLAPDMTASLRALLHNTISPTILEAGSKINVIPAEATARIDGRLAPGQTDKSFEAEIRSAIGDEIELIVDQYSPPLEASTDSPLYETIVQIMAERDPDATVVPALMTGGTDAKHICPRWPHVQVYGFMPHRQVREEKEMNLIHGHNERISVENLVFATRILYDIVMRFCQSSPGDNA